MGRSKSKKNKPAAPKAAGAELHQAVRLVADLMSIPGKSGQEHLVADYVVGKLREAGVRRSQIKADSAHLRTLLPGKTGNLVLKLPGTIRGPRRLLMAHMDTVPLCVGAQPVRRGNFFTSADSNTGLGADDRAGVAVVLYAAMEIVRRKLSSPPVTFCWTIQEETGLHGARQLNHGLLGRPKLSFNFDGGAPEKLTVGATGGFRSTIKVHGIASHAGGAPEMGVSAIAIAGLAIADLVGSGWHGDICKGKHRGTSNVGAIQGGHASNVVTDFVQLTAEARSHNSRFRQRIQREIEQSFQQAARQVTNIQGDSGHVEVDGRLDYESFRISDRDPSVLAAEQAIREVGQSPVRSISNGGLDANWMVARGIPTVTMGCGQIQQHTVSEALDIIRFQNACRIALRLATT